MSKKSILLLTTILLWSGKVATSLPLTSKKKSEILVAGYLRENSNVYIPSVIVNAIVDWFNADENYQHTVLACYKKEEDYRALKIAPSFYCFKVPPGVSYDKLLLELIIGKSKFPANTSARFAYLKIHSRNFDCGIPKWLFYDQKGNELKLLQGEYSFLNTMLNRYDIATLHCLFELPKKVEKSIIDSIEIVKNEVSHKKYFVDSVNEKLIPLARFKLFWNFKKYIKNSLFY